MNRGLGLLATSRRLAANRRANAGSYNIAGEMPAFLKNKLCQKAQHHLKKGINQQKNGP